MKDLLGNKIEAKRPKAKPVKRASPPPAHIPEIPFRPYRIVRETTTKVWMHNL